MYLARQATVPSVGPVSKENHGGRILTVIGCFTAFASLVVLARVYVRSMMLKTMGVDDWIIIVSMVSLSQTFGSIDLTIFIGLLYCSIRLLCRRSETWCWRAFRQSGAYGELPRYLTLDIFPRLDHCSRYQ